MTNYSSDTSTILTVRVANEDLPLSQLLAQHKQQPLRTLMRQVWRDYLYAELAKLNLTPSVDVGNNATVNDTTNE
ncbi:MAG: hypothetical protein ABG776_19145 [Cyanobacteria bacterium J06555_13]